MSNLEIVPEYDCHYCPEYSSDYGGEAEGEEEEEANTEIEDGKHCYVCCEYVFDNVQVIVNFHYLGKHAFTKAYPYTTDIAQIKHDLANRFHIDEELLQVMHWHVFLNDCTLLAYIRTECPGFMDLTVVNLSTQVPITLEDMVIPDIITVHIEFDDIYKEITVEIEDRSIRKPYIGGYRHKKSGIEYHHAFTQTGPPPEKIPPYNKHTRDSQTVDIRHRRSEQSYSRATQMNNEKSWHPTTEDAIITPKTYETAEEREKRIGFLDKVRTIQRYFRRWKLKKALKILCAEYRQRILNEQLENEEELSDWERQRKRELINKVFPRTRSDFSMLYAMVDRWKKAHIERISKIYTKASKLAEFYILLNKEIEMLGVIEKQRHKLKEEMKIRHEIQFFHTISDPIRWKGYKGIPIAMDTLETQKGRVFKGIYYKACNRTLTTEERVEFISELIAGLQNHNCSLGNEIVRLMQREIELLNHGLDDNDLDILRKRIQTLLLKHYKQVECNEHVTRRMLRLKEAGMKNDLIFCPRCEQLKSTKDFPVNHRNDVFRTCTICTWCDRAVQPWVDIAPYRLILRAIRRDERKRSCPSSIVFIMQEHDIYYLVERIWHSQSIINECNDIERLRFVRWDVTKEWSPWNCVLLSDHEAKTHIRIKDLRKVYDEELHKIIISKHMFARCIFQNVLFLEKTIRTQEEIEAQRELDAQRALEELDGKDTARDFGTETTVITQITGTQLILDRNIVEKVLNEMGTDLGTKNLK